MALPPEQGSDGAVRIPISGELDLHAFAPRDIPSLVEEYLLECRRRGILEVRIIHGKGTGFQRRVVSNLLGRLPFVASHSPADPASGGWGATIVRLSPPQE